MNQPNARICTNNYYHFVHGDRCMPAGAGSLCGVPTPAAGSSVSHSCFGVTVNGSRVPCDRVASRRGRPSRVLFGRTVQKALSSHRALRSLATHGPRARTTPVSTAAPHTRAPHLPGATEPEKLHLSILLVHQMHPHIHYASFIDITHQVCSIDPIRCPILIIPCHL